MEESNEVKRSREPLKSMWFDGIEVRDNSCSCFTARVELKELGLGYYAHRGGTDLETLNDISMTHIEVMRWIREAESFEYRDGLLKIRTARYNFYVLIDPKQVKAREEESARVQGY